MEAIRNPESGVIIILIQDWKWNLPNTNQLSFEDYYYYCHYYFKKINIVKIFSIKSLSHKKINF